MQTSERLSEVFGALADPTRRAILARLAKGEATVSELAGPFQLAQPTISKHLKVLEDAGLIQSDRDAQRRPRRLVLAPLKAADDWLQPFREQWERRFDRLEAHLKERKNK
ncbi:MAG: metalloregulator ArsR/SmtB family transcription factor [Myxococcaceae bacterium]